MATGARIPHSQAPARFPSVRTGPRRAAEPTSPQFRRLQLAQAAGAAGDTFIAMALAGSLFFSVPETTARGRVALYLGLTMAPFAIVAPLLARFLDNHRGGLRWAAVASAAGRGALAWMLATRLDSFYLFPIAFGVLMLTRASQVVRGALIPQLVPKGRSLVSANASLSKGAAITGIVAGSVGLLLIRWPGVETELRIASFVYAIAALSALLLPSPKGRHNVGEREGARAAVRSVSIRQAIVAIAGLRFLNGFLVFHLAFALRREEFGSAGLGLLIGSAAAGGLIGALVAPRLRALLKEEGILIVMLFVAGFAGVLVGRWFSLITAGMLVFAIGVSSGAAKVAFDSLVQRETPAAARGWAFARFESVLQLAWVAGAAAPLAAALPAGPGVMGAGILATLLGLVYMVGRHQVRQREMTPRGEGRL
ncbi:MAG TPA: MFS transporter [Actinomycetota bacterium]|nr:MFS transporter [Actinomycetota bacterium]